MMANEDLRQGRSGETAAHRLTGDRLKGHRCVRGGSDALPFTCLWEGAASLPERDCYPGTPYCNSPRRAQCAGAPHVFHTGSYQWDAQSGGSDPFLSPAALCQGRPGRRSLWHSVGFLFRRYRGGGALASRPDRGAAGRPAVRHTTHCRTGPGPAWPRAARSSIPKL